MNRIVRVFMIVGALFVFAVTASVSAVDFPAKTITIINPMSPGGSRDVTARAFASVAEKLMGQPVVVVNKPGAGGMIGMVAGAQAAPDGYTLTVTSSGDTCSLLWEVANDRKPPFSLNDFAPVGSWMLTSSLVVVPHNSPWKTLADLVKDCKAKPGHYAYASGGMYGITHISAEILLKAAGITARNVPYKGGGPSLTAVVGGHVDFSLQYPPTSIPLAQGKKLRILAILAEKRMKSIPDIPTVKEALGVEAESYQMVGLLVPRKTPAPALQKLRETLAKVVKDKSFIDTVTGLGEEVYFMNADELNKYIELESAKISKIMAELAKESRRSEDTEDGGLNMKAMVLERFNEAMVHKEVPDPTIGPGDILLRVRACGLCGTDLKIYDGDVKSVKLPRITGHEFAGEVVKVGPDVEGWTIGDHGVVHIYVPCGSCYLCRKGRQNDCTRRIDRFGFERNGGFGEYVSVPAPNLFKISRDVPLDQACILSGTMATPLHGIRTQGRLQAGETVVIVGIGGLGIHALQLAVNMGARVIAADIAEDKLEGARKFGAEATINSSKTDFIKEVRRLTDGEGADMIVEIVAGSAIPTVLEQSIPALRISGRLLLLGYQYGQRFSLDPQKVVYDELEIIGSRASIGQDLMDVISLVERGKVKPLISERFPLKDANEAFVKLRKSASLGRMVLLL